MIYTIKGDCDQDGYEWFSYTNSDDPSQDGDFEIIAYGAIIPQCTTKTLDFCGIPPVCGTICFSDDCSDAKAVTVLQDGQDSNKGDSNTAHLAAYGHEPHMQVLLISYQSAMRVAKSRSAESLNGSMVNLTL